MGAYQSSVGGQISTFESNVQRMVKGTLSRNSREMRARLVNERLSAPPRSRSQKHRPGTPLGRVTGRAIKSIRMEILQQGDQLRFQPSIGAGAEYIEKYEADGSLQFGRIFQETAARANDEMRIGLAFLAANPGRPGVLSSDPGEGPAMDAGRAALFSELGARYEAKRERAKMLRKSRKAARFSNYLASVFGE